MQNGEEKMAIFKCTCYHEAQDKMYGRKRRVFNPKADRTKNLYTCTVCGKEYSAPHTRLKEEGKKKK